MHFKIPGFLRTAMDQVFSTQAPEENDLPSPKTAKVAREDLTAFATNQPYGDRQKKIGSEKLARSWEFAADQFELAFLGQENKTATEELRTEHIAEAMHGIAGKIRKADNFQQQIELDIEDIEAVANAGDLFLRAKLARDQFDKQMGIETPNTLDGLHFKAGMFLAPYIPDTDNKTVTVPVEKIHNIVGSSLEDMNIKPETPFALALAMEKLGDMMTEIYDGYYDITEAYGPYMLQTHFYDIAVHLRKAGQDAESIEIPKSTLQGIEYKLDHMNDAANFLRSPGGLNGTVTPTEDQLFDREILIRCHSGIWQELSEYFENAKPVVTRDFNLD